MQVQIRWGKLDKSDALGEHVHEQIDHALRHYKARFSRVVIHLHDDNESKGGPHDKRCVIEARPNGAEPLAVEGTGSDLYKTVSAVANKLERAVRHFVDRHRDH